MAWFDTVEKAKEKKKNVESGGGVDSDDETVKLTDVVFEYFDDGKTPSEIYRRIGKKYNKDRDFFKGLYRDWKEEQQEKTSAVRPGHFPAEADSSFAIDGQMSALEIKELKEFYYELKEMGNIHAAEQILARITNLTPTGPKSLDDWIKEGIGENIKNMLSGGGSGNNEDVFLDRLEKYKSVFNLSERGGPPSENAFMASELRQGLEAGIEQFCDTAHSLWGDPNHQRRKLKADGRELNRMKQQYADLQKATSTLYVKCSQCSRVVPKAAAQCAYCHAVFQSIAHTPKTTPEPSDIEYIECDGCGEDIPDSIAFCPHCGFPVGDIDDDDDDDDYDDDDDDDDDSEKDEDDDLPEQIEQIDVADIESPQIPEEFKRYFDQMFRLKNLILNKTNAKGHALTAVTASIESDIPAVKAAMAIKEIGFDNIMDVANTLVPYYPEYTEPFEVVSTPEGRKWCKEFLNTYCRRMGNKKWNKIDSIKLSNEELDEFKDKFDKMKLTPEKIKESKSIAKAQKRVAPSNPDTISCEVCGDQVPIANLYTHIMKCISTVEQKKKAEGEKNDEKTDDKPEPKSE